MEMFFIYGYTTLVFCYVILRKVINRFALVIRLILNSRVEAIKRQLI